MNTDTRHPDPPMVDLILTVALAGAINQRYAETMEFLNEEIRVLRERNHQGLDEDIISPGPEVGRSEGQITCRERLGGTLRYYYREAS